jgi:hypothetical protein
VSDEQHEQLIITLEGITLELALLRKLLEERLVK